MASISCDYDELIGPYTEAKERLEVSLKLYRLVVLHNISSEIPVMQTRVKRSQAVYERLYVQMYPDGNETHAS